MGSKKLFNIPADEGGIPYVTPPDNIKKPAIQIIPDSELKNTKADYHHAIQICSILPYAYQEAEWLYEKYQEIRFREMSDIFRHAIGLGKWTVNLLVQYKNDYVGWEPNHRGHKELYKKDEKYENIDAEIKKTTNSDLSFLHKNPIDYGEINTVDQEWMLWNYMNKANQILISLEQGTVDYDLDNLRLILNNCLSSSYRICTKLKKYTGEHTSIILDRCKFNRNIPW